MFGDELPHPLSEGAYLPSGLRLHVVEYIPVGVITVLIEYIEEGVILLITFLDDWLKVMLIYSLIYYNSDVAHILLAEEDFIKRHLHDLGGALILDVLPPVELLSQDGIASTGAVKVLVHQREWHIEVDGNVGLIIFGFDNTK
jgi:hypothetical protein